jgi:hypothetical protein
MLNTFGVRGDFGFVVTRLVIIGVITAADGHRPEARSQEPEYSVFRIPYSRSFLPLEVFQSFRSNYAALG